MLHELTHILPRVPRIEVIRHVLMLASLGYVWAQDDRLCQFTSPDPRYMIERLPGQFTYEISSESVKNLKGQQQPIILNVTGLYGKFAEVDGFGDSLADVMQISNPQGDRSEYGVSNFNASCSTVPLDDLDKSVYSYCWYEGFILLSAERYIDEKHLYFMVEREVPSPVCSLTITSYSSNRGKLDGTFEYDDDLSNGSPRVLFKFKVSNDTFPHPVIVSPYLTCSGDRINITQLGSDLFSADPSIFGYSQANCNVIISNQEKRVSIEVLGLPKIQRPTFPTSAQANDNKADNLSLTLVYGLGAGLLGALLVAIVFIVLYWRERSAGSVIINASKEEDRKSANDFRNVEADDADSGLIAPDSNVISTDQTLETQFSMDKANYNNSNSSLNNDRVDSGKPAPLTENPPV